MKAMKDILVSTEKRSYSPSEKDVRVELLGELAQMYRSLDQTEAGVEAYRQMADLDPDKVPRWRRRSSRPIARARIIRKPSRKLTRR